MLNKDRFNKIRYGFFDVGNTLIFPDFKLITEIAGKDTNIDKVRRITSRIRKEMEDVMLFRSTEGENNFINIFAELYKRVFNLNADDAKKAGKALYKKDKEKSIYSIVNEGVIETLEYLKERLDIMSVISNADGRVEKILIDCGIRKYFDRVYDSYIVGLEKPDIRYFQKVVDDYKINPEESFYIGDFLKIDIEPAVKAGMKGILYDPFDDYDTEQYKIRNFTDLKKL